MCYGPRPLTLRVMGDKFVFRLVTAAGHARRDPAVPHPAAAGTRSGGPVDSDQFIKHSERAVFRELAENEGGVLLHLDTGAYHGLNSTGTLIWNLVADGATLGEVVNGLRAHLGDGPEDLQSDVAAFVDDLAQRDLLTVGPSGT